MNKGAHDMVINRGVVGQCMYRCGNELEFIFERASIGKWVKVMGEEESCRGSNSDKVKRIQNCKTT